MDSIAFGTALDTWGIINKYLLNKDGDRVGQFPFIPSFFYLPDYGMLAERLPTHLALFSPGAWLAVTSEAPGSLIFTIGQLAAGLCNSVLISRDTGTMDLVKRGWDVLVSDL